MAPIIINSLEEMGYFGKVLAWGLVKFPVQGIFLNGELGCGKTTMTRALVKALPGGESAEVASPSFTMCNYYPTKPAIVHCDLYREPHIAPEEVYENFDRPGATCIIEWASFLERGLWPAEVLELDMEQLDNQRLIKLKPVGAGACALHEYVLSQLSKFTKCSR